MLLIRRTDAEDFWQSVTGSKDDVKETFRDAARREVLEETGIDCRATTPLALGLCDWQLENVYDIYPRWLHRYPPGVTRNTEHLFSLQGPPDTSVTLNPREHTAYVWLPYQMAAEKCFSSSNAEAILMLPKFMNEPVRNGTRKRQ